VTLADKPPNWAARIAATSAALVVLVLVLMVAGITGGLFGWHPGSPPAADPSGETSLPARVGAPGIRSADEIEHPLAAASVLISGNTWFIDGSDWYGGLIGAGSGGYRVFDNNAGAAGMGAVLSPDGRRVASGDGILDIAAGRWTRYPAAWRDRDLAAQAWSPDGTRLAVTSRSLEEKPPYPGSSNGTAATLNLLEVATGAITEVAELDDGATLDGWTAAFSPDGARLAYQARDHLRILTLADRKTVDFPLPPGSWLAGKGGWTRDGRSLLVVAGERCASCGDYPVRWTITTVAATTGAAQGPRYRLDGAYAVRVLGWWPSGRPVAVAYAPTDDAPVTLFDDASGKDDLISLDKVGSARLLELAPGSEHRRLSSIGTETVDVADNVLAAGRIGPGQVPATSVDRILAGASVVAAAAAVTALLSGAYALARRLRRRAAKRQQYVQ
jgi:hypothetical protein